MGSVGSVLKLLLLPRLVGALPGQLLVEGSNVPVEACRDPCGPGRLYRRGALGVGTGARREGDPRGGGVRRVVRAEAPEASL